ncbi:MAG TPA: phage gp6-like head-tail connector protein [Epulopiscium sp.]|nr:phage gp6-like head-tail connector protein [Candidatus Epulonipiscium sp.]
MVVTLEEVKLYLRIDGDEENTLITHFVLASQELCEGILRFPLSDVGETPEVIKQAILYGTGCFYEQREMLNTKEVTEVMKSLLFALRKESW